MLAGFCNFETTLDNMLQDWGINSGKIQQRLLAEKTPTLTMAIELAQGMETAAKSVKELSQLEIPSTSLEVLRMCTEWSLQHVERHL